MMTSQRAALWLGLVCALGACAPQDFSPIVPLDDDPREASGDGTTSTNSAPSTVDAGHDTSHDTASPDTDNPEPCSSGIADLTADLGGVQVNTPAEEVVVWHNTCDTAEIIWSLSLTASEGDHDLALHHDAPFPMVLQPDVPRTLRVELTPRAPGPHRVVLELELRTGDRVELIFTADAS